MKCGGTTVQSINLNYLFFVVFGVAPYSADLLFHFGYFFSEHQRYFLWDTGTWNFPFSCRIVLSSVYRVIDNNPKVDTPSVWGTKPFAHLYHDSDYEEKNDLTTPNKT